MKHFVLDGREQHQYVSRSCVQTHLAVSHHTTGINHHAHNVGQWNVFNFQELIHNLLQNSCCDLQDLERPKLLHISGLPLWVEAAN